MSTGLLTAGSGDAARLSDPLSLMGCDGTSPQTLRFMKPQTPRLADGAELSVSEPCRRGEAISGLLLLEGLTIWYGLSV